MIFLGYPGVGKSTLGGEDKFIDLESSNFFVDGVRAAKWYIPYCQIAEDLSRQGYNVFLSTHKDVREYIIKNSKEKYYFIYPSEFRMKDWVEKLKERAEVSNIVKNKKAYEWAKDHIEQDILDIKTFALNTIWIDEMDYNLKDLITDKIEENFSYINKIVERFNSFKQDEEEGSDYLVIPIEIDKDSISIEDVTILHESRVYPYNIRYALSVYLDEEKMEPDMVKFSKDILKALAAFVIKAKDTPNNLLSSFLIKINEALDTIEASLELSRKLGKIISIEIKHTPKGID